MQTEKMTVSTRKGAHVLFIKLFPTIFSAIIFQLQMLMVCDASVPLDMNFTLPNLRSCFYANSQQHPTPTPFPCHKWCYLLHHPVRESFYWHQTCLKCNIMLILSHLTRQVVSIGCPWTPPPPHVSWTPHPLMCHQWSCVLHHPFR